MRPLSIVITVLVLGVGLVGCGGDSVGVAEAPEPTASSTSTVVTPPPKPDGMDEATLEAAASFVYYWIDVQNYATETGETEELRAISGEECLGCNVVVDMIEEIYGNKGYIKGNLWHLGEIEVHPQGEQIFATGIVKASKGETKASDAAQVKALEPMESTASFWVSLYETGWQMVDMTSE